MQTSDAGLFLLAFKMNSYQDNRTWTEMTADSTENINIYNIGRSNFLGQDAFHTYNMHNNREDVSNN